MVSGYTTNKTLPFFAVNNLAYGYSGFAPDVTIHAITPGAQPSSIATTDEVRIFGGNVDDRKHDQPQDRVRGGMQDDYPLSIVGTKSVTISANIGAGNSVYVTSYGPLTISGNVLSDTNEGGAGGIYIDNAANGAPTTISGNLTVPGSAGAYLFVDTNGPTTISGDLTNVNSDIWVANYGTMAGNFTTISGNVVAGDYVRISQGRVAGERADDDLGRRHRGRRRRHRQLRFVGWQHDDDQRQRHVEWRRSDDPSLWAADGAADGDRNAVRGRVTSICSATGTRRSAR